MKLGSAVLGCRDCMSVNFHDLWRCFTKKTRGAKLDPGRNIHRLGLFLRVYISRFVQKFCMKLGSAVLGCRDYMSVNFHDFWRFFTKETRSAKLDPG
jgi:hypothetical protein